VFSEYQRSSVSDKIGGIAGFGKKVSGATLVFLNVSSLTKF